MKLENKKLIVKRSYKEVYKCDEGIVKIFEKDHPKADVFNEALNTARVEATGLEIPKRVKKYLKWMESGLCLLNTRMEQLLKR